jgi:hypothetical protein
VLQNGKVLEIDGQKLDIFDYLIAGEGSTITADSIIGHPNDFTVDESLFKQENRYRFTRITKVLILKFLWGVL